MRYRKVYPHMWSDSRVRALTPIAPSGQGLWIYMLVGEQTGPIPGVFRIGEAAFAEQLGWPLGSFREAFAEVFREGLAKADWKARVVWLPNGIKWNKPASPNVVSSWSDEWKLLPDCSIKADIHQAFKAFLEGCGDPFAKAFAKACPIQEQDPGSGSYTERYQKPRQKTATKPKVIDPAYDLIREHRRLLRETRGIDVPDTVQAGKYDLRCAKVLMSETGWGESWPEALAFYVSINDTWYSKDAWPLSLAKSQLAKITAMWRKRSPALVVIKEKTLEELLAEQA